MFSDRLRQEFLRRRHINSRYSLRAFATLLGVDHSTLSQVFRGKRRVPATDIRRWSKKFGIEAEEIRVYLAAEALPAASVVKRMEETTNWTAEAAAVVAGDVHWRIVQSLRDSAFRPDIRWISERTGVSVDEVNIALTRMLRLRLMRMDTATGWVDTTGTASITEQGFRNLALIRLRERMRTI